MIDIAIIGAGPAGLSAAINIASRNKRAVVFGNDITTSLLFPAENVNNYLGMPNMTGAAMMEGFVNHARQAGIEIKAGKVLQVLDMGGHFALNVKDEFYEAKAIILATGISKGKAVKGENEYLGKGVSYCATCDGMLYKGKDVAVIGETEEAEEDANFLSEICSKVYFIPQYAVKNKLNEKLIMLEKKVKEVAGEKFVERLLFDEGEIEVKGAFFIKQNTPVASLVPGLEIEEGCIKINRLCETNVKGVFAAGDCTGWPFQVANAVGEGLIAGQNAVRYCASLPKTEG